MAGGGGPKMAAAGSEESGPGGRTNPVPGLSRALAGGSPRPGTPALPPQASRRRGGRAAPPPRGSGGGTRPCSAWAGCCRRGSCSPFASGGWCRAGRPQVARAEGRGAGSCVPFPDVRWMFLVTSEVPQQCPNKHLRGLTQMSYPALCCSRRLCPFPSSLTPSLLSCRNR